MELGKIGVWTGQVRGLDMEALAKTAATIEALGYQALWIPGGAGGDILERCEAALGGTSSLVLATGILNIWRHEAAEVAATTARLNEQHGGRLLLGLGVSHERLIKEEYIAPLAKMATYLDQLDAAGQPPDVRVLAALRRRMLDLARDRAGGAHPYFVPPEHTEAARVILGPGRRAGARADRGAGDRSRRGPPPGSKVFVRTTWGCRTTSTTCEPSATPTTM